MNKVVAVVVTYNRIELLKKCLNALMAQSYPCDILIVDNASTDGTEKCINKIKNKYSNLFYKNTGTNIGGAGGFNFGMRWAVEAGYEYVWVMDDDSIPFDKALYELIKASHILKENYGFLYSKVIWKDKTICNMNKPKFCFRNFYSEVNILNIKQATFVSLFIPAKVIKMIGLPIKEFFIWGDDIEYTIRINKFYKSKCYYIPKSIVMHLTKNNVGSNIALDHMKRIDRYRYAFRNEFFLYKKMGIKGITYYITKCIYNIFRIIILSKNNKYKRLNILLKGVYLGYKFNPKIEKY